MQSLFSSRTRKLAVGLVTGLLVVAIAGGLWWTSQPDNAAAQPDSPLLQHGLHGLRWQLASPLSLMPGAVTDPPFPALTYSIHTFLWWNEATRTIDLDQTRLMRFSHVKQQFSWVNVQPQRDVWHWDHADAVLDEVEYRGLELVARLDGPPQWAVTPPSDDPAAPPIDLDAWGTYCGTLAARYRGRIAGYQVWNEPNLSREWLERPPNAEGYVAVLKACSQAIRQADPDAIVISAGLAPTGTTPPEAVPDADYLRQMYRAGAAPWFDVLGLNAPGYKAPPEMSPDKAEQVHGNRWMCFRHVEDMRRIMIEEGDAARQIALLEVGWTTDPRPDTPYEWHAVSEATQADYLVRAYHYAARHWRPWVGLMVTIYMGDGVWTEDDEEYWWAINIGGYIGDWTSRPAYVELANMRQYIDDVIVPRKADPGSQEATIVDPLPPRDTADDAGE
jgi:polysaccharide biosynthesis protein PslG